MVSAEPRPPSEIAPGVPAELEKLIQRCLRKDPDRRVQRMADVRVALQDAREEVRFRPRGSRAGSRPTEPLAQRLPHPGDPLALAGGALAVWRLRSTPAPVGSRSITRVTWDSGLATDPAPSPAGNLLAYASDRGGEGNLDIWLQPLPRGEPIRLTERPGGRLRAVLLARRQPNRVSLRPRWRGRLRRFRPRRPGHANRREGTTAALLARRAMDRLLRRRHGAVRRDGPRRGRGWRLDPADRVFEAEGASPDLVSRRQAPVVRGVPRGQPRRSSSG